MSDACPLHADRPENCPQAHTCICGKTLSAHWSAEGYCKPYGRGGKRFRPDTDTLLRFGHTYAKK